MAIYNTQDYLDEAIQSVLNQDLDFESHVQLILVDDGSTDDSHEICQGYQKRYPDNILVLRKDNGGPASARNMGLEHACGEYVNFLDSDDRLSANALSEVSDFFTQNDTDLVTLPIEFFERKTGGQYMNYKFDETRLIDLCETFDCPQLSASTAFIRRDAIGDIRFSQNLANGEDFLFVNQIMLEKMNYGVLNTAKYYYRKREGEKSLMDDVFTSSEYFTPKLENCFKKLIDYCLEVKGEVPKFIQYAIVQDLHGPIRSDNFNRFVSERNEFYRCLDYILLHIDEDMILAQRKLDEHAKSFLMFAKNREFHITVGEGTVSLKSCDYTINNTHNNKIRITGLDIIEDTLHIEGYVLTCCYNKDLTVKLNDLAYSFTKNNSVLSFAGIDWLFRAEFEFELPVEDVKIQLAYDEKVIMNNRIVIQCDINEDSDFEVSLTSNTIRINRKSLKDKFRKVINW
jgi:glycosyltransferase involved in cell wall biosynthesis